MPLVETAHVGAVLTVMLNNPPFNFLTDPMLRELETVLERVDRDPRIRAVVLTSAVPDVFISHYDVNEILTGSERVAVSVGPRVAAALLRAVGPLRRIPKMAALLDRTPVSGINSLLRYHAIIARMRRSSRVYVCALNGRALGGGCELALGCDIRVMADGDYQIGQPEILIGLLPGGGGIQALARSIGISATIELVLEGHHLNPKQAHNLGIIHHLARPQDTVAVAEAIATRLARRSPAAVAAIKRALYIGGTGPIERGLAIERAGFMSLASQPGTKNAMRVYRDTVATYEQTGASLAAFIEEQLPTWMDGRVVTFDDE